MAQPQIKPSIKEEPLEASGGQVREPAPKAHAPENLPLPKKLPGAEFIETPISRKCFRLLRHAQLNCDFVVIYAGAGFGKTKAAEEHKRLSNQALTNQLQEDPFEAVGAADRENCFLITMTPEERRLRPCISRIGEAFGIRATSIHDLNERLAEILCGTDGLLIIDEAQNLQLASLECVRYLHEHCPVGLCLMGNERSYTNLTGGRTRASDFAPLYSRLGMRLQLKAPTIEDVAAISRGFGVVLKQDNELLHEIAMKPGALRNVVKSLRLAYFAAQSERRPISGEDIWAARYALVQED